METTHLLECGRASIVVCNNGWIAMVGIKPTLRGLRTGSHSYKQTSFSNRSKVGRLVPQARFEYSTALHRPPDRRHPETLPIRANNKDLIMNVKSIVFGIALVSACLFGAENANAVVRNGIYYDSCSIQRCVVTDCAGNTCIERVDFYIGDGMGGWILTGSQERIYTRRPVQQ
jgi:hypothetical protein